MNKLIRTERSIAKYNICDEHIISEENIDSILLETLLLVVSPKDGDPLLYEGYILNENQLEEINNHLKDKFIFSQKIIQPRFS